MGVLDRINSLFSVKAKEKPVTVLTNTPNVVEIPGVVQENAKGFFKAYIPEFLYKPPYGYPRKENLSLIRSLATTPYVFSITKTLCDEVSSLKCDIKIKDDVENPEKWKDKLKEVKRFFKNPNSNNESWEHIQRALIRDYVEVDSGVIVKVFNKEAKPKMVEMYARDGVTFLKNPDIYGTMVSRADFVVPTSALGLESLEKLPKEVADLYYFQYAIQQAAYFQYGWTAGARPIPFGKREIAYMMGNPRTDSIYGRSPVEICADAIMLLHYGEQFSLDYYLKGGMPEGMLSIPGAPDDTVKLVKDMLEQKTTVKDGLDNWRRIGHKIPVTNFPGPESKGRVEFIKFTLDPIELQILEQQKWFSKLIWSTFGVTAEEMSFTEDSNKAISGEQSKVTKRKAIRPICNLISYNINTQILPEFVTDTWENFDDAIENCPFEFYYDDYDVESDIKKHQLFQMKINMGIMTPEMVAKELGINVEELKKSKDEAMKKAQENAKLLSPPENEGSEKLPKGENIKKPTKEEKGLEETKSKEKTPTEEFEDEFINYVQEIGESISKISELR